MGRYVSEAWFGRKLGRQPEPAQQARPKLTSHAGMALIVTGTVLLLAVSIPLPFLNVKLVGLIMIVAGLVKVGALQRASSWLWRNWLAVMAARVSLDLVLAPDHPGRRPMAAEADVRLTRFTTFGAIGGSVFLAGLALQFALVRRLHMNVIAAYAVQSIASIEASFLLNRWLTWRDRDAPLWRSLWRFNVSKTITVILNFVLYAGLIRLGMNYLVANIALTAAFTVVNYVAGDKFAFQAVAARAAPIADFSRERDLWGAPVSVVIPCRNNQATIRDAVVSLLNQDYAHLDEILLIGSPTDRTWSALGGIRDPRVQTLEVDAPAGLRDANYKRDFGIGKAANDLIVLVDSDIVLPRDWMSTAVSAMDDERVQCVTGGLKAMVDSFWGRYTDHTVIGAKTPRIGHSYLVTSADFGRAGRKPPITANAMFTRELYEACPIDPTWSHGSYEDYEWFWRVTAAGYPIYVSSTLYGWHYHRQGWRELAREYRRSARGCAYFIRAHRDCPFAQHRLRQALTMPAVAVAATVAVGVAVQRGYALGVAALITGALIGVCAYQLARSWRLESIAYPAVGFGLGLVFTTGLVTNLVRPAATPRWLTALDEPPALLHVLSLRRLWHPLTAILAVQAAFSLSLVWSNTAYGDEAAHILQGRLEWSHWLHGTLYVPQQFGDYAAPQIYPLIGAAANDVGGLAAARILAMCFMLAGSVFLYQIGLKLFGRTAALAGVALWAVSEPVLRLTFANWDPLACLLVIASLRVAVQVGGSRRKGELVALSALILALAAVTALPFLIYVPVVVTVALLIWIEQMGVRLAVWCASWLAFGSLLIMGLLFTVFHLWVYLFEAALNPGVANGLGQGISTVIRGAWARDGLIFAVACAGAVTALATEKRSRGILVAALAVAILPDPLYQAHLGTAFALDKQISAGSGLAALAAGYLVARCKPATWRPLVCSMAAAALLIYPAFIGLWYARSTFHSWPNTGRIVRVLAPVAKSNRPVLVTDFGAFWSAVPEYYLGGNQAHWLNYHPTELTAVRRGLYAAVVVDLPLTGLQSPAMSAYATAPGLSTTNGTTTRLLHVSPLVAALEHNRHYRLTAVIPYKTTATVGDAVGVWALWVRR